MKITIDRATVEQALEALEAMQSYAAAERKGLRICDEAIPALRAALAQQAESDTCAWYQDGDSESGVYATSCRRYFDITDGTPEDNKMQWCCYCGKKLAQELITEDNDE